MYYVDDYCEEVGKLIDNAQREIKVAVYLIRYKRSGDCPEILLEKLVAAKRGGVDVIVFTEDDKYNKGAIRFLRENNIPVFFTDRFLHGKVLKTERCFVVGSHNWTWNAMHKNLEASVIVCNSSVIERFFEEVKEAIAR